VTRSIETANLNFSYGDTLILDKINIAIEIGSFVGIIGPNGGGKTTFLKLLMGFLHPSSGTIRLFGQSPHQMRHRIGYLPQFSQTDRDFPITVLELVLLGAISNQFSYPPDAKAKALQLLEELGLSSYRSQPFSSLSGGLAQRALFARALISDPDLLLLDEPTANIDPSSKVAILDILSSFKGKKTILLVTHDLKTVIERVDLVLCIQNQATSYLPELLCEHFALGLYHAPLLAPTTTKDFHAIQRNI